MLNVLLYSKIHCVITINVLNVQISTQGGIHLGLSFVKVVLNMDGCNDIYFLLNCQRFTFKELFAIPMCFYNIQSVCFMTIYGLKCFQRKLYQTNFTCY